MRQRFALVFGLGVVVTAVAVVAGWWLWDRQRRLEASRVKVVDNFTDGAEPNLIGGKQTITATNGNQMGVRYLRMSTPTRDRMALGLDFRLVDTGTVTWAMGLNGLDVSAAEELLVWVRSTTAAPPCAPARSRRRPAPTPAST